MPPPSPRALLRLAATLLLLLWGGFWLWFAGASIISEFDPETVGIPLLRFVLPVVALLALGVFTPRPGGVLLIAGSVYAGMYYDNASARLLLALPMLLCGLGLAVAGPWVRRFGRGRAAGPPTPA
jgi:hypothetical protein